MELKRAEALIMRAIAEAERISGSICVAVCDSRGLLIAFARMDAAPARSVEIAQCKAYSAARLGVTTQAFHERLVRDAMPASYFCDPRLTGMPGGSPLRQDGEIVGAIGVSGLLPSQDQAITDLLAAPASGP